MKKLSNLITGIFVLMIVIVVINLSSMADVEQDHNLILFEDWETKSFENWDDDFIQGDNVIDTSPVFQGRYAIKQKSTNPGNLVHYFGDHPLIKRTFIDRTKRRLGMSGEEDAPVTDVTLEEFIYPMQGFKWPSHAMKLWIMNSFEGWGAKYTKSEGKGKPHSFAPYYMTIAVDKRGQPFGELVRADGLGGPGELWRKYSPNRRVGIALIPGTWNKLRFQLRLNTPGKNDGIFRLWIDDKLLCDYADVNFRGTYTQYGWNHLMMSMHGKPSHPQHQWMSRDNITLKRGDTEAPISSMSPSHKGAGESAVLREPETSTLNQSPQTPSGFRITEQ